jgi:hypothetical protein
MLKSVGPAIEDLTVQQVAQQTSQVMPKGRNFH